MAIALAGQYGATFAYYLGPGPGSNTIQTPGTYNQAAGNLIVGCYSSYDSPNDGGQPTITDQAGNTGWTFGTRYAVGINRTMQFFWKPNCAGYSVNAILLTFPSIGSGQYMYLTSVQIWDVSGAALTTPACGAAMGFIASGTPVSTGMGSGGTTLTTTKTNSLILAYADTALYPVESPNPTLDTSPSYTVDRVNWGGGYDNMIAGHLGVTAIQTGVAISMYPDTTCQAYSSIIMVQAFADATQPSASTLRELMLMGCGT